MLRRGQTRDAPHAEHVNQVLLGEVVLPVYIALEGGKDAFAGQEGVGAVMLEPDERLVRATFLVRLRNHGAVVAFARAWWKREVLELLSQNNDGLLDVQERVLEARDVRVAELAVRPLWWAVERVASVIKEGEDKVEALCVELRDIRSAWTDKGGGGRDRDAHRQSRALARRPRSCRHRLPWQRVGRQD